MDRAPQEATTADGEPVTLLCNVASAAETRLGLSGGAAARASCDPNSLSPAPRGGRRSPITWPT